MKWRSLSVLLLVLACMIAVSSRADTVASLLGNFTINQFNGVHLTSDAVDIHYAVVFGQLPAIKELHAADTNGDGVTSQQERDDYVESLAPRLAEDLIVNVDGHRLPLKAEHWSSSLPSEQGGFSLRIDIDFSGVLPPTTRSGPHSFELSNQNYAGRMGWHEIQVLTVPEVAVFDTNAYNNSLTGGLTQALQALPVDGPLDERIAHLTFEHGAVPVGSAALGMRPGSTVAPTAASPASAGSWIERETRRLVTAISAPRLAPRVALLTLLAAIVLGAVHALSPGHGKTIVGAYLIGSRGTPRHAAFLGLTVTVTHTLGVFILGFATLYASRFIVPERLFPILSLVSAVLVLGMGIVLLIQRVRSARLHFSAPSAVSEPVFYPIAAHARGPSHGLMLAHSTIDATLHSHGGGPLHSHLPPGASGEKITWRSLLALGISGGLVPCPSAMVLLLAAVALNKTAYGMVLVVAFSLGLAVTLTAVGMAFLYARNRFRSPEARSRWPQLLPVLSAGVITLVGMGLCFGALKSFGN